MSEEELIEYVAGHTGQSRRKFLERLLVGAAFAAPVIASFSIGGASSSKPTSLEAGGHLPACGPNTYFDESSNTYFDMASNTACDPDGGSNTTITTVAPTTTSTVVPTTTTTVVPTTTTAVVPTTTTTVAVTTTTGLGSGAGTPGAIPDTE